MHAMTDEQIDALTGREMDAAVAEWVMEWKKVPGPTYDYDGPCESHVILVPPTIPITEVESGKFYPPRGIIWPWFFCPKWSTDIAAAFSVAQHMAERIFRRTSDQPGYIDDNEINALTLVQCSSLVQAGAWMAAFRTFLEYPEDWEPQNVAGLKYVARAPTAPLAICRAALRAVRKQEP